MPPFLFRSLQRSASDSLMSFFFLNLNDQDFARASAPFSVALDSMSASLLSVAFARSRTAVNAMLGQSHSLFSQRLISKAEEYGAHVEIVREDFTTRTCGACGHDNEHVGSKKVFLCPRCGWTLGRDANGARNIMMRYIVDTAVAVEYKRGG